MEIPPRGAAGGRGGGRGRAGPGGGPRRGCCGDRGRPPRTGAPPPSAPPAAAAAPLGGISMTCPQCGAPMPPEGVICDYCGSRQDVDLRAGPPLRREATARASTVPTTMAPSRPSGWRSRARLSSTDATPAWVCSSGAENLEQWLSQAVGPVWEVNRPLIQHLIEHPRHQPERLATPGLLLRRADEPRPVAANAAA